MTFAYLILSLYSSFPLILHPSLLSVCPGICCQWPHSSSWSGLRLALAASPRPCHAPAAFSPPGWATSEVTVATLASDNSPFDLNSPPWLSPSQTLISVIPVWIWFWGSSEHRMEPQVPLCKIDKERPDDLGLLKGLVQFNLVWPCSDQQTTCTLDPSF